jgi:PAS domain S-box-containing protein
MDTQPGKSYHQTWLGRFLVPKLLKHGVLWIGVRACASAAALTLLFAFLLSLAFPGESRQIYLASCALVSAAVTAIIFWGLSTLIEHLRWNRGQLEESQRLAHLGSWEWDIPRNVISWSPELYRIYGLDPNRFGASYDAFLDRVHEEDRERIHSVISAAIQGVRPFEFHHRIVTPKGVVRVLHGRGHVVLDRRKRPVRMMGTAQDVTEQQEAKRLIAEARDALERRVAERTAELSAALRTRDEFLSIAAHELRTPLSTLQLQVERLAAKGIDATSKLDFERVVSIIARQVHHLADRVDELLDMSRFSPDRLQMKREPVDLVGVVDDVLVRLAASIERAHCTVELDANGPVVGHWDRSSLDHVVTNLLSNALKYGAGKPIDIRVEMRSSVARLVIRDRGIGIAEQDLDRIFERFERAASVRHYGGFGVGLYLVRRIVEAHGGTVSASSAPDQGATFVVELPTGEIPTDDMTGPSRPRGSHGEHG